MTTTKLTTVLDGLACQDCAIALANDDWSGIEDQDSHAQAMADAWFGALDRLEDGVQPSGGWIVGEPVGFSTLACDACGDPRHGDRHEISVLGWVA